MVFHELSFKFYGLRVETSINDEINIDLNSPAWNFETLDYVWQIFFPSEKPAFFNIFSHFFSNKLFLVKSERSLKWHVNAKIDWKYREYYIWHG